MSVLKYYPPPEGFTEKNFVNATNGDIITAIKRAYPLAVSDCGKHAMALKTGDFEKDCLAVWTCLKDNLAYKRDMDSLQTIALPRVAFKRIGNDCKSFSTVAAGLVGAMGYTASYRFAGYKPGVNQPSHVYIVATNPGTKKKFIIDGCSPMANWEKTPVYKQDFTMDVVTLHDRHSATELQERIKKLSYKHQQGLKKIAENAIIKAMLDKKYHGHVRPGLTINRKNKEGKRPGKKNRPEKGSPEQIALKKKRKDRAKAGLKKFGHANMYAALILGRGAFLACIRLNLNGMASKLKKLKDSGKFAELDKKWYAIGGILKLFHGAIDKGANKKPLFLSKRAKARFAKTMAVNGVINGIHITDQWCCRPRSINVAPLAAVAAAAIPVIAAIVPIMVKAFKGMGHHGEAEAADLTGQATDIVDNKFTSDVDDSNDQDNIEVPDDVEGMEMSNDDGGEMTEPDDGGDSIEDYNYDRYGDPTINSNDQLWGALGEMAGKGIEVLANKIKKKNPKAAPIINKGAEVMDDYATGAYLRQSGIKKKATVAKSAFDQIQKYALPIAAVAVGGILLLKKK